MARFAGCTVHTAAAIVLYAIITAMPLKAAPLPALGADTSRISVSGLSSGGYMAGQFQVAYSKLVIGSGIVAGGPYACAYAPGAEAQAVWLSALTMNALRAQGQCMADSGTFFSAIPTALELLGRAKTLEKAGKIDALANLHNHKVYLFWGGRDDRVVQGVVTRAVDFYQRAGVPTDNISFVTLPTAAHAFVTDELGLACGTKGSPYLNDCDYDQAGAILTRIHGPLKPAGLEVESSFVSFDQTPYSSAGTDAMLADTGMAYIPANCRKNEGCGVHVAFHGCEQGGDAFTTFVKNAGYARWAESNRLIVLFPRVRTGRLNPKGCWDWWGYTGPQFLERDAPQMLAVRQMIDQLVAAPRS